MESNFTFDLLILSPKSGWTSFQRFDNADEARNEARKLVSADKHEGVKITQEHFDYVENRFLEKTIFLRTRSGSKLPESEAEPETRNFEDFGDFGLPDKNNRLLIGIASVVVLLAVLLGVGIFFLNQGHTYHPRQAGDLPRYELPTIRTNVMSDGKAYAVQMTLEIELYDPDDAKKVEADLAPVMEAIIEHLQHTDIKDLNSSARLQYLRAMLRKRVTAALGGTDFNDILFKDIQVRLR